MNSNLMIMNFFLKKSLDPPLSRVGNSGTIPFVSNLYVHFFSGATGSAVL
uniref:Uncharacterized protein n=1 Tax=Candidatus Kentrum sp. LPFa TaxID=2126335 RepID=A0A450XYR0_9GAMM|nr:MAG: hypothetical protein BECKLPF1236A_GA0070988_102606 [Candidatus Kentron sp. LPFa]VFK34420.1 MAG: hypothetical protein BECKLPF1236C_GA0070990_102685 [Candidatus Kentron sp. LPFa]